MNESKSKKTPEHKELDGRVIYAGVVFEHRRQVPQSAGLEPEHADRA